MPLAPDRRAAAQLAGRTLVFVIGAPRSGTTWIQLLLAQHRGVATTQETHLFERYLAHLDEAWRRERALEVERDIGLRPLLSEDGFHTLCRGFAEGVLRRIEGEEEGKRVIVEKTPGHALSAPFIHALFPEAHFVHVIRDPRAVVSSLLRAGSGWGSRWAPRGPATAAGVWRTHVEAGLAIPELTERYHEVRYEQLHENGVERLGRLLESIGLSADAEFCERAFEACSIDRLKRGVGEARIPWARREPEGFYGEGRPEGWRGELSRRQLRVVEYVAGETMNRAGYDRVTRGTAKPLAVRRLEALERLRGALDWRLGRSAAGL